MNVCRCISLFLSAAPTPKGDDRGDDSDDDEVIIGITKQGPLTEERRMDLDDALLLPGPPRLDDETVAVDVDEYEAIDAERP